MKAGQILTWVIAENSLPSGLNRAPPFGPWRRQNDTIVIHSVSAGSRYRTNSRAIDWTSKTLLTVRPENNYIVDRQSLALNISSTISALAYECELIETKRKAYDDALDDTRQILQAA